MRLYEISEEFKSLRDIVENDLEFNEETGEVVDTSTTIELLFNGLLIKLSDKLDGAAYIAKELEQTADALKDEAKRLTARASHFSKNADRLKALMLAALVESEEDKIKTDKWTFSTRKSETIEIDPLVTADDMDRKYTRLKREFDKVALKAALKDGIEIEGVSIATSINLSIK